MKKWIGNLLIERSPPEKAKFRPPLVLIHGLWSGSWCWQPWATHFCNLGWDCWALNFRGRLEEDPGEVQKTLTFQDCVEDLRHVIRACDYPPVLAAHNFGSLTALKAAEEENLSALILVSPLLPGNLKKLPSRLFRLLRLKYFPLMLLRRPFRLEEKDLLKNWLASLPEAQQTQILERLVPESICLMEEFWNNTVELDPTRLGCPTLVVGGDKDRVVSITSLRDMADTLRWDFQEYRDHGHWILGEGGGETMVRDIHRWIVQKLGEQILLADFSN